MSRTRLLLEVLLLGPVLLGLPACHSGPGTLSPTPRSSYDIVLENGKVVDGTGNAWFQGDVGVAGDRIAWVGPAGSLGQAKAKLRIDARGMVVAPGFIDIQSGSYDNFLVGDGRSLSKVTQGVTTEIMGEAYTPAPWNDSLAPFQDFFFLYSDSAKVRAALD
jgi:N-acyl-D-amino-acid deacylase